MAEIYGLRQGGGLEIKSGSLVGADTFGPTGAAAYQFIQSGTSGVTVPSNLTSNGYTIQGVIGSTGGSDANAMIISGAFVGDGRNITNINVENLDAAGSNDQVQFNDDGEFGASADFTFVTGSSGTANSKALIVGASNTYDISGSGALTMGSNIRGDGTLTIAGNSDLNGTINVEDAATLQSTLSAQSSSFTTIYGSGAAQFGSTLKVQGAATLDSTLAAQSASFTTIYGSGAAQIAGAMRLQGALTMDNVTISDAGAIAGATSIDASGDLTVGSITMAEFSVDSSGNTDIDGTLNVESVATLQNNLVAQSASFTTVYGSGAARLGSSLAVEGNADLDGQLDVAGQVDLAASGVATTVRGTFNVDEAATFDTTVSASGNIQGGGTLTLAGNADLNAQLDVQGAATLQSTLSAQSASFTTIYGSGAAQIAGALRLQGALTMDNVTISDAGAIAGATSIDASGDLTVGSITMAEFTVDSSGNTDIDGTLNVESAATLQSTLSAQSASFTTVYGSGAARLGSTLAVEGNADFDGQLDVASVVNLAASGVATTVRGTFNVDEAATFDSTISGSSTLQVGGNATVMGAILPDADSTYSIGSPTKRWANVYTGDLHLRNERGDWTLFEEADHIKVRNNLSGKMFRMALVEDE
jgi:fibronectin-binding autotransporter adhesin